jgi:hypothetical protein
VNILSGGKRAAQRCKNILANQGEGGARNL